MTRTSSRLKGRRGRGFVLACELLEDRTVPAGGLAADLATAQTNLALLHQLDAAGVNGPQAALAFPLAQADTAVEQQILSDVRDQLTTLRSRLNTGVGNLRAAEAQALAPFGQQAGGLATSIAATFEDFIAQLVTRISAKAGVLRQDRADAQAAIAFEADLMARFGPPVGSSGGTPAGVSAGAGAGAGTSSTPGDPALVTLQLNPLDVNLLGLEIKTDQITVNVSAQPGSGELLGNLLTAAANLINIPAVNSALNNVLGGVVNLLNSASLNVSGVGSGSLTNATAATTPVLDAFVAPVHLNLLGAVVDTSPIHLTITAHSGQGLVLGNVVADLANLFNPPLPKKLDLNTVNARLTDLLNQLNAQIPGIAPAPTPATPTGTGQILSLILPPINLNLLGLNLKTNAIQVNASATTGNGDLLGNVLQTLLNTLGATPDQLNTLNANLNALLAKVVGVLNASNLTLASGALGSLTPVLQQLASPTLVSATPATTPVLDLSVASTDGTTPPVDVNLLGLTVTTSDIHAQLNATTGDGQVLGNLVYNVAHLLDPGGTLNLLGILGQLAL